MTIEDPGKNVVKKALRVWLIGMLLILIMARLLLWIDSEHTIGVIKGTLSPPEGGSFFDVEYYIKGQVYSSSCNIPAEFYDSCNSMIGDTFQVKYSKIFPSIYEFEFDKPYTQSNKP